MTNKTVYDLYYDSEENTLERIEENCEYTLLINDVNVNQVLNIAKTLTRKYDEVRVYDSEEDAYLSFRNRTDKPLINVFIDEAYDDIAEKYGLAEKKNDYDETDLDKEKWDNYWNDYNQCGVRIDNW